MNWSWSHSRLAPSEDLRSTAANSRGIHAGPALCDFVYCRHDVPR